eukprot:3833330-Rhodomonas_salina.2
MGMLGTERAGAGPAQKRALFREQVYGGRVSNARGLTRCAVPGLDIPLSALLLSANSHRAVT